MIYVALLRGINVGGNSKVEMKRLKQVFEKIGQTNVSTYINSGNVIFESPEKNDETLVRKLENAIEKEFSFAIKVVVKSLKEMEVISEKLPDSWKNDLEMKTDIMFLSKDADSENILHSLKYKPELDNLIYTKGVLIWMVKRRDITKSGLLKIVGTPLYKQMTIRNCNTFRKLLSLLKAVKD